MYLRIDGIQSGPFSPEDVSRRYSEGELESRTMSWCEGEDRWTTLGKRWPIPGPKLRRISGAALAIGATGAALALPIALLETLPVFMQSGTVLWCCVIALLAVATVCLHAAEQGNRRPRKSLPSVLLAMALAGCGALALALTGLSYAVLQVRHQAANALVSFDQPLDSIRINGEIGPRLPEQVQRMLAVHPDARGIELNSPGGLVVDAMKVARLVSDSHLFARVDGECASACVAIWAASPRHQMTATSRLGLHQIRFELDLPYQIIGKAKGKLKQQYDGLLRGAGFSEQVIQEKDRTAPAQVFWLDPVQVADSGVTLEIYGVDGAPVSETMARWLWLENALGKKSAMRNLLAAIREHASSLMPGHAEELYASFRANDPDAARRAGRSLSDAAKQYAFARASDQAVFEWGKSLRDLFDRTLAQHDAFGCALLSGREPSAPKGRREAVELADSSINSLAGMIETLPPDPAEIRTVPTGALDVEVKQRTWKQAMSKGYPAQPTRWTVFQHCGFQADYYDNVLQLPIQEAAAVLRSSERPPSAKR